ncbi:MAG: hypothetical protein U0172_12165 [Nitrospiraceae bacterium]
MREHNGALKPTHRVRRRSLRRVIKQATRLIVAAGIVGAIYPSTLPLAIAESEGDGPPVPIARVLLDPSSFNLDVVTLLGTIRDVRPLRTELECGSGPGFLLYLRDETGELPILNQGACTDGEYVPAVEGRFTRGQRVLVRAAIVQTAPHEPGDPVLEATLVRIRPEDE